MKTRANSPSGLMALLLCTLLWTATVSGDENVRPAAELIAQGYQPVLWPNYETRPVWPFEPHSLAWPVAFASPEHSLGNVMAQFQPFDDPPYFHGGVDVRATTQSPVHTPVAGWLEAGHYGYSTNPDGSMEKYWKPWPQYGEALYFEVAVVTPEGFRLEQHHMDRARLPQEIVTRLNQGRAWVEAGTLLGYPVRFSRTYDHIHYNVIYPDGTRLNPEFASPLVPDSVPPRIIAALAVMPSGRTEFLTAPLRERPVEIVLACLDKLDLGPYEHPPTRSVLRFENGLTSEWDFTRDLTAPDGSFPPLPEVFGEEITAPDGRRFRSTGGYGDGTSLIRLKVPKGASGDFQAEISDAAGNLTRVTGSLPR